MSEWWTYRLSSFLLFAPRTYYRLLELYNAEVWPAHLVALALGLALCVVTFQGRAWAARAACAMLGACWLWVAWAFHLQRYATINWAATGFAAAFAMQGLLLAGAAFDARLRLRPLRSGRAKVGLGLLLFSMAVQPALGVLQGRPWYQAEVFGIAADPTTLGTLGVLLLMWRTDHAAGAAVKASFVALLWPIPLLWCAVSGATLWAMHAADASLLPAAALLALFTALRSPRARSP